MIAKYLGAVGAFVLFIIVLILCFSTWGTIQAGHRGVVLEMGKVTGEIKPEGFYTKMPGIVTVVSMNVQIQKEQVEAQAASKDLQTVNTSVSLNLSLDPAKCASVYQDIDIDYLTTIVAPAMQESIKAIIAQFTAEELISRREDVREGIAALLATKLSPLGIKTEAINIVNFQFSNSFNEAIEAKVTAEQNALAAQNKLAQVKFEADQAIATAEGQAKAIAIQSEAIQQNGGAAYIQLKAIEKWDGKLPEYNMAGAPMPFVPIK